MYPNQTNNLPTEPDYDEPSPEEPRTPARDNPDGCPSLLFTFGSVVPNTTSNANIVSFICSQQLEELTAKTTLLLPDLDIDIAHPPIVEESSRKLLDNGTAGVTAFQYRIQEQFANQTEIAERQPAEAPKGTLFSFDLFYISVTSGIDGIPPSELIGPANAQKLLNATTHHYRKYMAQAINLNMRTNPLYPHELFNGTFLNSSRQRLRQNRGSKLALQILLGVMAACGGAAYLLVDMRGRCRIIRARLRGQ
jgi:hypothetical protein